MAMMRYTNSVHDASGNVLGGASVRVTHIASSTPALLYSDEGVTRITNPIIVRPDGVFSFYTYDGDYKIEVTSGGVTFTLDDVSLDVSHIVYKAAASDPVADSDVTAADTDLFFPVREDETYNFHAVLYVTSTLAADFKFQFSVPAATTDYGLRYRAIDGNFTAIIMDEVIAFGADEIVAYTVIPTLAPLIIDGTFKPTANGALQLMWAQGTATVAEDTIVGASSFIVWQRAT
jgi:hypothetical protein